MRLSWIIFGVLLIVSLSYAGDWPGFEGPDRNGISSETGLATSWPEGGPKPLWHFDLEGGFGGCAVKGGKVYVPDRIGNEKDVLHCLDLADGNKVWSVSLDAPGKFQYPGPRATPAVDDKCVFYMGPTGNLYCVKLETHKLVWQKSLVKDFGSRLAFWAVAESPLLYKNWVIIAPLGGKVGLAALDKKTGQTVWSSKGFGGMGYTSPMITTIDNVEQVVMIASGAVVGADVKTGRILWQYTAWPCPIPLASPTAIGDGRLFVTCIAGGPYKSKSAMFRPQLKNGQWTVEDLFQTLDCQSQMHNGLLYDKYLYAYSDGNGKGLVCMDLDGKIKWNQGGLSDKGGDLVIAQGMIYLMDGNSGTLHLIQASPEGYKELASAKVLDAKGGEVWAPMSIADGKLLCRDQKQLKCLDISGK
jgi:outer membrane protein assembly factor BamB